MDNFKPILDKIHMDKTLNIISKKLEILKCKLGRGKGALP